MCSKKKMRFRIWMLNPIPRFDLLVARSASYILYNVGITCINMYNVWIGNVDQLLIMVVPHDL